MVKTVTSASAGTLAVLDVGSSKICCFVADFSRDGAIHITGIGGRESDGVRNGAVIDMAAAQKSIGMAVDAAEKMANGNVRDAVVGLSGGQLRSSIVHRRMDIGGKRIEPSDVAQLLEECRAAARTPQYTLLHAAALGFTIDDVGEIENPEDMHAQKLALDMHATSLQTASLRNMTECVNGCHLRVRQMAINGYAAGLATLVEEEAELGAVVLDMGGGGISIAAFQGGMLTATANVPVGGRHVTRDLARGLSISFRDAEKLKVLHGSALPTTPDDRSILDAPQIGEDRETPQRIPKHYILSIIAPRIEETLELVREQLNRIGAPGLADRRVVLTGGASQLPGLRERAVQILGRPARIGHAGQNTATRAIRGQAEATRGPAFAAATGLLLLAAEENAEPPPRPTTRRAVAQQPFPTRLKEWFYETF